MSTPHDMSPDDLAAAKQGLLPLSAASEHYADGFTPLKGFKPPPNYSQDMTGPGRWFLMRDPDGALYGMLFTNDDKVLGLIGMPESSTPLMQAGMTALRTAFANGVDTTAQFDFLFGLYGPGPMASGDLGEMLKNLVK